MLIITQINNETNILIQLLKDGSFLNLCKFLIYTYVGKGIGIFWYVIISIPIQVYLSQLRQWIL